MGDKRSPGNHGHLHKVTKYLRRSDLDHLDDILQESFQDLKKTSIPLEEGGAEVLGSAHPVCAKLEQAAKEILYVAKLVVQFVNTL